MLPTTTTTPKNQDDDDTNKETTRYLSAKAKYNNNPRHRRRRSSLSRRAMMMVLFKQATSSRHSLQSFTVGLPCGFPRQQTILSSLEGHDMEYEQSCEPSGRPADTNNNLFGDNNFKMPLANRRRNYNDNDLMRATSTSSSSRRRRNLVLCQQDFEDQILKNLFSKDRAADDDDVLNY